MTTAVSASIFTVSTGTSPIGINSTIARFSDRAIMPSTVRITGLPGWAASTRASIPSMLARESGSGFTCETTTTRENGARTSRSRSDRFRLGVSGSSPCSVVCGSAVIVGWVPGGTARRVPVEAEKDLRSTAPFRVYAMPIAVRQSLSILRGPRIRGRIRARDPRLVAHRSRRPACPLDRRKLDDALGAGRGTARECDEQTHSTDHRRPVQEDRPAMQPGEPPMRFRAGVPARLICGTSEFPP